MRRHKRRKKQCRKVLYGTRDEARAALNAFGRARGSKRYYRCPHCPGYHLTSRSAK